MDNSFQESTLNTLFSNCRQCGSCCKKYRKITLSLDEIDFIKRMGGHVGTNISMKEIREKGLEEARREAAENGKVYMIHPDDKGCIFLERRNDSYFCKIYHYRPQACRGYRCNLADDSMLTMISGDAHLLLGQNSFGLPLEKE